MARHRQDAGRGKPVRRPSKRQGKAAAGDLYEAIEEDPLEERQAGRRFDRVDNYEYELPSDFEDEEIDEDTAFGPDDQPELGAMLGGARSKRKGSQLGAGPAGGAAGELEAGEGPDLLDSDEDEAAGADSSGEEELQPDDYSEDGSPNFAATRQLEAERLFGIRRPGAAVAADDPQSDTGGKAPPEQAGPLAAMDASAEEDDQALLEPSASEEEDAADEAAAARHAAMLAEVRSGLQPPGSRKRKAQHLITEAYPESEFNLQPASATAGGATEPELTIEDLLRGLGDTQSKLGPARKTLERIARATVPVTPPLPSAVQQRQRRRAGYEAAKEEVTKWQPIVKANREAPTLHFKSGAESVPRPASTAALATNFAPATDMEAQVAQLLEAAGAHNAEAIAESEEALALKELTVEEARARRERLARMRSLLFHHEQKAKRLKAIKSKDYHRHAKRAAKMNAKKAAAAAGGDEDGVLRLAAEEAELGRIRERLTLKHRNSSRWARRALRRGVDVMDPGTKAAVEEQLRLGEQLRRKVDRMDDRSDASGGEGSTSASEAEDGAAEEGREQGRKAASARAREAALALLQGSGDPAEEPRKGLFSLPFMQRGLERQRQQARSEAQAMLKEIEQEEAAGRSGADGAAPGSGASRDADESSPGAGRMSFGAQLPLQGLQQGDLDNAGSGSDAEEDAEAKATRLGRRLAGGKAAAGDQQPHRQRRRRVAEAAGAKAAAEQRSQQMVPAADQDHATAPGDLAVAGNGILTTDGPVTIASGAGSARATQGTSSVPEEPPQAAPASATGILQEIAQQRHNISSQDWLFQGSMAAAGQPAAAGTTAAGVSVGPATARSRQHASMGSAGAVAATALSDTKQSTRVLSATAGQQQQPRQALPAQQTSQHASDSEDDAPMKPAGGKLSQRDLIARAFAGDDVEADFAAEKAAEVQAELPSEDLESVLPGWGAWASQQREPRWMREAKRKAKQDRDAAAAARKDSKLQQVIITERYDKKAAKYGATSVPFPFGSKEHYERSVRMPLGSDFNATMAHRDMTRPAVIKQRGTMIQPLKYSKPIADQKLPKDNRQRKMVATVAGGMPKRSKR